MRYEVVLLPSATRDLRKLPRPVLDRIVNVLRSLAAQPRTRGCRKLQGDRNLYRARSGDYRILYEIVDDKLLVAVVRVAHRSTVYRDLSG